MNHDNFTGSGDLYGDENTSYGKAKIRVIGVGGAGNNAINRMIAANIKSAEYIAVNTDAQILAYSKADKTIQLGAKLTRGLGAGSDPKIGHAAAEDSKAELERVIDGTDLLFITAGMGGGTGTGAAPVIAAIAKEHKILTVAVVTLPFKFEAKRRMDNALEGVEKLKGLVDSLIVIPNEKIRKVVDKNTSFEESLRVADEVLMQGIRGIAELIITPALINLDFADVRTILKGSGMAHMGVGVAKGENRISRAVQLAVNSPLLDTSIFGATGVIFNVVGGANLTLDEVNTAADLIRGVVAYNALIIVGACIDENIKDEVEITVIATGFPNEQQTEEGGVQKSAPSMRFMPQQPIPPVQPAQQQPAQPRPRYPFESDGAPYGYAQQPVQPQPVQPQPVPPVQPAQPVPPVAPANPEPKPQSQDDGKRLPPFLRRVLDHKNKD